LRVEERNQGGRWWVGGVRGILEYIDTAWGRWEVVRQNLGFLLVIWRFGGRAINSFSFVKKNSWEYDVDGRRPCVYHFPLVPSIPLAAQTSQQAFAPRPCLPPPTHGPSQLQFRADALQAEMTKSKVKDFL